MIIDQLFEDDKKKKLNEIDPRNYDSDEDYYNDLHGDDDEEFDGDAADDEVADMDNDEESYYEKYVRTKNLEGYETTPFGRVSNTTPNYSQAWKVTDEGEEFLRKAYQRLKRAYEEEGQVGMINIGPALSELQQQKFGPAYVQQSGPYQMMTTDISRLIEKIEPWQKQYGQQHLARDFDPEDFSNWNKQQGMSENTSRKVDAKGLTQGEWMQAVKQKFPDAKIVQAKMIDGPAHALLSDGRKIVWNPVQGMAEGYDTAEDYRAKAQWLMRTHHLRPDEAMEYAYYDTDPDTWVGSPWEDDYKQGMAEAKASTAAFRASNAKRAKLNAMSPEERKEYDKEQAEKQRKRDDARLEKDRQKLAAKKGVSESKRNKQRQLYESMLMEDPVYRKFKTVGRYIAERRMSEKEILQVFADAEAGMTDKATGANRTFLGRGKDTTMDFAGGVADALKGVWGGIQKSVPIAAVDYAYDAATDALADVTGGQKGAIMQAIKKYRMLAKQYPKTAGLAKAALVAITGMATGGAAAPAIAALVYGLDSAIKGEKFSDIALKAGGAAATAWAASKIAGAVGGDQAGAGANASNLDPSQFPAYDDNGNLMPGFHINPEDGSTYYDPSLPDEVAGLTGEVPAGDSLAPGEEIVPPGGAEGLTGQFDGGQYTVQKGDQIGYIAQGMGVKPQDITGLNPQIDFTKPLQPGTTLNLPPQGDNAGSLWTDYVQGSNYGDKVPGGGSGQGLPAHSSAASDYGMGGNAPIDYSQPGPISTDSLGQKLEYGMPVSDNGSFIPPNPNLPAKELATQQAAYDAWKSDFMRRFPNATQLPDGTMQAIKPGLAPMYPTNYTPGMDTGGLTPKAVQESIKFKKLPFDKMVDQKITVMNWALSESIGRKSNSVHLSTIGTYTVFENVDRYRKAIMELAGVPGSTRPEYYRPDMSGAPAPTKPPKNQSWFGKGLDYLDKGVKKVGSALGTFGHQLTTNVTKEKLKMNWHQDGKPSDSDKLAAWLVGQGVPQDVVTTIYGKMGIPYTAPAAATPAAAEPAQNVAKGGTAQKSMPFYGTNPDTKKPWTYDELQAKAQPAPADAPADTSANAPAANPAGFNAGNIFKQPGMEKYAKPAPAKTPNFAQQGGGYGKVTTSFKPMTGAPGMKPAGSGQGTTQTQQKLTPDEYVRKIGAPAMPESRVFSVLKKPVAEMLSMVETKEDVAKIKQFVDQTFVKYGAVSESAFVVRNKLIEHITQVGAQRRREFARKS